MDWDPKQTQTIKPFFLLKKLLKWNKMPSELIFTDADF